MAYIDALQDRADIFTIGYVKNAIGEQIKNEVILYSQMPCRLMRYSSTKRKQTEGYQESQTDTWLIQVQPQHDQAKRGDKCIIDGQTYLITSRQKIKGSTPTVHHVVYLLDEYNG